MIITFQAGPVALISVGVSLVFMAFLLSAVALDYFMERLEEIVYHRHGGPLTTHHLKYSKEARAWNYLNNFYCRKVKPVEDWVADKMMYTLLLSVPTAVITLLASPWIGAI